MGYLEKFFNWEVGLALLPMLFIIYRSYGLYIGRLEEQKQHAEATASLHLRTIEALALAIEAKDQTTGDHLRRVQIYAREIAKELGLSEDERLALQAASILHDVGKIAVPDYIISKPGRLTPEEFKKMKVHPVVGAEIVERIDFPYPVAPIVRAHHEKWDGSGYPFGLREEQIPIGARILTAVDCFDALASDRQYRKALPLDQVLAMVQAEAGKSFDPRVVEILTRRHLELEKLSAADQAPTLSKFCMDFDVECGDSPDAGFEGAVAADISKEGLEASLEAIAGAHQQGQDLYELVHALGHSITPTDMMALICARLNVVVPCDSMAIFLLEGNVLKPRHVWGENSKLLSSLRIPLGQGVCGWVAENLKPILNGNPLVEPGYLNDPNRFSGLRSVLALPLHTSSRAFGVIALYKTETDGFSRDHLRALAAINSKISLMIGSLSSQKSAANSHVDPITGLPNARALFLHIEAEIARCRAAGSSLTLLVCDLDGFRQVNELYGQLTGDRVLQSVASGLRKKCRENDYLARKGGDEFVLVLPRLCHEALKTYTDGLPRAIEDAGSKVCGARFLSLSIGTATFPDDGDNPETLLAEADRRMYVSKQTRRHLATAESEIQDLAQMSDSVTETPIPKPVVRHSSLATQALR
jgi:diguanylate cyclase (GGDEF)-like protein/putative nucleotidyltransferase with HDIG domain